MGISAVNVGSFLPCSHVDSLVMISTASPHRTLCGKENSYPHGAYILEVVTENKSKERNSQASKYIVPDNT